MEKTTSLNVRVNPEVKRQAEEVLNLLGIPMATAVDMYLRQIALTGGIPFDVTLPVTPPPHRGQVTEEEVDAQVRDSYARMMHGRVHNSDVLNAFKDIHR